MRLQHYHRVLWIDAVCINQQNINERSQQVAMMCRIYSNASRCLVYLGMKRMVVTQRWSSCSSVASHPQIRIILPAPWGNSSDDSTFSGCGFFKNLCFPVISWFIVKRLRLHGQISAVSAGTNSPVSRFRYGSKTFIYFATETPLTLRDSFSNHPLYNPQMIEIEFWVCWACSKDLIMLGL